MLERHVYYSNEGLIPGNLKPAYTEVTRRINDMIKETGIAPFVRWFDALDDHVLCEVTDFASGRVERFILHPYKPLDAMDFPDDANDNEEIRTHGLDVVVMKTHVITRDGIVVTIMPGRRGIVFVPYSGAFIDAQFSIDITVNVPVGILSIAHRDRVVADDEGGVDEHESV